MKFSRPDFLFLLFLLIPGFFLFLRKYRDRKRKLLYYLSDQDDAGLPFLRHYKKIFIAESAFFLLAFFSLFLALARPSRGREESTVPPGNPLNIALVIDLSKSMMTPDLSPNRLKKVLGLLDSFIRRNPFRYGLVIFKRIAYPVLPMTKDKTALLSYLEYLNPHFLSADGTNGEEALSAAADLFTDDNTGDRLILLVSDGEFHDRKWMKQARRAAEKGIPVYTLGVGTEQGGIVPEEAGTVFSVSSRKRTIRSALKPGNLRKIAAVTGGRFFRISTDSADLSALQRVLDKTYVRSSLRYCPRNRETFFIVAALVFLLGSFIVKKFLCPGI